MIQIAEDVKASWSEEAIRKKEKTYRKTYGIPYKKPRKPWLHSYVKGMAWWYQTVTKKEPKAGTDSVFPAFIRNCLDVVEKLGGISDAIIRTALDAYKKEKSALGRSKKKR